MKPLVQLILLSALALAAALAGCASERDPDRVTELTQPEDAIDERLMLTLGQARNYHHLADVYLRDGDLKQAEEAVRRVLAISFPANAPEAEDVLADTRARLAKLLIPLGRLDEALAVVDEGIARATRPSFFTANLHTVRGEVLEARGMQLKESDPTAARTALDEAIRAFEESIRMNDALQKMLMEGRR